MLVLTRKENQSIQIGSTVTVTVLEIRGNSVRIGIAAPGTTAIMRDDAKERIAAVREALASGTLSDSGLEGDFDYLDNNDTNGN